MSSLYSDHRERSTVSDLIRAHILESLPVCLPASESASHLAINMRQIEENRKSIFLINYFRKNANRTP